MSKNKIPVDLKKEDVLALDVATHCGYCTCEKNGTWDFSERSTNNYAEHKDFRDTLIRFIKENNIRVVVAEDVSVGTHFNAIRKLSEFRGVMMEVCDELNLPEPVLLNPSHIKKFATGSGKADKKQMIAAMEVKYGLVPYDDNACDAFWIYKLFCNRYRI